MRFNFLHTCLLCLSLILGCTKEEPLQKELVVPNIEDFQLSQMSIVFAGDYMQHEPQLNAALYGSGTYDFKPTLRYMDSLWSSADFVAVNFETTIGNGEYTGYPTFKSPAESMSALKECGVDIIFTANNHCCDGGGRGLARTIECADSLGLMHIGTYRDSSEYEQNRVLFVEKSGIKVALLNYTYGTNGIRVPKGRVVSLIDTVRIKQELALASSADVKIVSIHWGWEYNREENREQRLLAAKMREWGADVVMGSHPHVVQPTELYMDSEGYVTGAVFYSLGNFISNQRDQYRDGGLCVKLYINRGIDGEIFYGVESVPVWVHKYVNEGKYRYQVLPEYVRGKVQMSPYESYLFERSMSDNELHITIF